jgi:hypothetical protein
MSLAIVPIVWLTRRKVAEIVHRIIGPQERLARTSSLDSSELVEVVHADPVLHGGTALCRLDNGLHSPNVINRVH